MKNKILLVVACFLLFPSGYMFGQTAMGGWRTHFAYNSVVAITQSSNKIYAVSDGMLFSVGKKDGNIELYSKLTGLNGTVISQIEFDKNNGQLLICYNNGNIDFITANGIVNIPDFYNKVMNVNKNINHINIYENKAYLSCNFGIIVLDLKKREFADTYYIGANASEVNVVSTAVHGGYIYALAYVQPAGSSKAYSLLRASLSNQSQWANYENWDEAQSLPATVAEIETIASFGESLFLLGDEQLFKLGGGQWEKFIQDTVLNVSISGDKMFATNDDYRIYIFDKNLNSQNMHGLNMSHAHAGVYDEQSKTYWFAGNIDGVMSYTAKSEFLNRYRPNGPAVNTHWDMTFGDDKLFLVQGGWDSNGVLSRAGYVMIYEEGQWTNISPYYFLEQTGTAPVDFVNVGVDPLDNTHFFVSSFGYGLYEFREDKFYKKYDHRNSIIQALSYVSDKDKYVRVNGAVFDNKGNLFFTNSETSNGTIKVIPKGGDENSMFDMPYPYPKTNITMYYPTKIHISNQNPNQKWVLSERVTASKGIGIFDDAGTLTDTSDDKKKFYNTFIDPDKEGEMLTPNYYYSIAQDENGVIWVGTDKGPLLFYNLSKVFDSGYTCSRVKIPRNDGSGQADLLLSEESIRAIAIDGANRKWLGTSGSGVYLMSENGQETIHHFTTANSPLLSNEILSIAINPVSGEVFFATGGGLMSYQSDAAMGEKTFSDVHAYPNPVREGFSGTITITGLVDETQVKITDLNGNLICETVSNGSVATWNGRDASGRKVNTGIYLALCVSSDGTQSAVAKILVIN